MRPIYQDNFGTSGGYDVDFDHWEMSGVDVACAGERVNVGVKMDKGFIAAGGPITLTGASTYTIPGKEPTGTIKGYTIKIMPNTKTIEPERVIPIQAVGVSVDDDGVYITRRGFNGSTGVKVLDVGKNASNNVVRTFGAGWDPIMSSLSGSDIWVSNSNTNNITKFNVATGVGGVCHDTGTSSAPSQAVVHGSKVFATPFYNNNGALNGAIFRYSTTCGTPREAVIYGANTQIVRPRGIVAHEGEIFVGDPVAGKVLVFNTTDEGNVAPKRVITGFDAPWGVYIDHDRLYVSGTDNGVGAVNVYHLDASGAADPLYSYRLPNTVGLNSPAGITVHDDTMYVADLDNGLKVYSLK